MNTLLAPSFRGAVALAFVLAACGDDTTVQPGIDAPPLVDAAPDAPPTGPVWRQVEHLARPGINEALLISEGFLAGYNATAPSFSGVDPATLGMVVGEAKTVLKALYLGACLINGGAGLSPTAGLHPAGLQCVETTGGLFSDTAGTVLKATVAAGAQAYADKVFGQFIPDVMRIDVSANTPSSYLTLCGDASSTPLLCGGRRLADDTIDVTYDYLIAGAAIHLDPSLPAQFHALVSDGVQFSLTNTQNALNVTAPDGGNTSQGHPNVSNTFPYSAPPL
jgi:hypothetical protein